jgi:hypothetical protein
LLVQTLNVWRGQASDAEYAEGPASETIKGFCRAAIASTQSPKTHERIAGPEREGLQRLTRLRESQKRSKPRRFRRPEDLKQEKPRAACTMRSRRSAIECACEQGRSKSRKPGRTSLDRSAAKKSQRQIWRSIPRIKNAGADVHPTSTRGSSRLGQPRLTCFHRNKAAKGQTNPMSVVDRPVASAEARGQSTRSRP